MQGQLVCAWCNKKKKDVHLVTAGTAHGICPACLKRVFGFTVQTWGEALAEREQQIQLDKAKKRLERRQAKKRRSASVR